MAENKLAKGTIYLTIAGVALALSNYIIHISVAKFVGVELYGIFGILASLFFINSIFVNNGVPLAVSKYVAESKYSLSSLIKYSAISQSIASIFIILFYVLLAKTISIQLLKDASLIPYLIAIGVITVPLSFLSLYTDGFFSGLREFKKQAVIRILYSFLRIALVLSFLAFGFKLYGVLAGFFLSALICLLLAFLLFKREKKTDLSDDLPKINFSMILQFAAPLIAASLAFTLTRSVSVLFIKGILADNIQVGLFTAASTLANISYVAFSALPVTLLPSISKSISEKNIGLTKKYISQSLRYLILLLFPITAIVAATPNELIVLFYSSSFLAAGPALSLLVISSTLFAVYSSLRIIIIGSGKPKTEMRISIFSLIVLSILSMILIPSKGIYGAAIAALICSVISLVILCSYIFIKFRTLVEFASFLRILLSSILIFLIAYFWHFSGIWLVLTYLILFLFYLLLLYLFGEIKKEDIKLFSSLSKIK